jgi:dipeptidyl aminopeptidase/acylaminoacyl peptidase
MYQQYQRLEQYVRGGTVEPHWLEDGESFWYVEQGIEEEPVYLLDPRKRSRRHLFDLASIREHLQRVLREGTLADGLPLRGLIIQPGSEELIELSVGRSRIEVDTRSGQVRVLEESASPAPRPGGQGTMSPDGKWAAWSGDHNVWVRSIVQGDGQPLTMDGTADQPWGAPGDRGSRIVWAPDGSKLAVAKLDLREVPKIPITSHLGLQPEVQWVHLWAANGPFDSSDLFVIEVGTGERVRVDAEPLGEHPDMFYLLGWLPDGSELLYAQVSRDFKTLRVSAVLPETGQVRRLFQEEQTFFHIPFYRPLTATVLAATSQFLWISARDGSHHLYLYDFAGNLVRRLTDSPIEVIEIIGVDENEGWVYFTAHSDPARPYDTHLCRVSLHGGGIVQLTAGQGIHQAVLSPQEDFFLDTRTNVDLLPVVELRSADGQLVDTVSVAVLGAPDGFKWVEPEEFAVKAADGETDLYGVLYKPYDFDPAKRYPVIEIMVGRPTVSVNQILRTRSLGGQALAQLGFIVVALDGRGTPERGHAFHAEAYGSMGRHEIPDHVAALNGLFEAHSYMDRNRVGVIGHSYGGYYAIRAMLQAPETYHVGVASAPLDPRMDAVIAYMGLPEENPEGYEHASNLPLAGQLKGRLMVQHGSADSSVPLFYTMQLVEAMMKAGKRLDLLILPDEGHGLRPTSAQHRREVARRYLQEHLQPGGGREVARRYLQEHLQPGGVDTVGSESGSVLRGPSLSSASDSASARARPQAQTRAREGK